MADGTSTISELDSILGSVRKLLTGVSEPDPYFDQDLIIHINANLLILNDLGVGPPEGFFITGEEELWKNFIESNKVGMAASYVYLKVKIVFDPPASSTILESINRTIQEYEWRLCNHK